MPQRPAANAATCELPIGSPAIDRALIDRMAIRVLQSFPHKIGAGRICTTAWHQAAGVAEAGGNVLVYTGAVQRPLPPAVITRTTLARGRLRIPYKALGQLRALQLHDRLVARALPRLAGEIDLVHAWPLGALETLRTARRLGIPAVLERPNAHTRYAYQVVAAECERLGVSLPADQEHAFNAVKLAREEQEYALADRLLCPSDFVLQTFLDQGTPPEKLIRHSYGFDDSRFFGRGTARTSRPGLSVLFAGVCAVRKGLHLALDAWLRSSASEHGTFSIAGEFLPDYRDKLAARLAHPSVRVLGHRHDLPELMRLSDVLVLPSLEEGSALVCMEAIASGCVPLVSDRCGSVPVDTQACVHPAGDVEALSRQISALDRDRDLLRRLRGRCLELSPELTWRAAGRRLLSVYAEVASAETRRKHAVLTATQG